MIRFFTKLFHRQTEHVTSAAALLGVASLASRAVGLVRDRLLAAHFGAGPQLDAYYAAFRWPDTLYNLLIVGALTAGFIPIFTECREQEGESSAAQLAGRVLSVTAVAMGIVSFVLIIGARWIVPVTVAGFSPAQIAETVTLTKIMALSPLLLGLSAIMGGVLQSSKRFFAFALAPMLYNLGIILGVLFLAPRFGIRGVALGVVLGAVLHLVAQTIPVLRTRTLFLSSPSICEPRIRRIFALMGPRTLGLAITQLNLIVLLGLASSLSDGSVSVLAFANNLQSVPLGLVGISFAVAALPVLAEAAAKRNIKKTTELVSSLTRQVLVLVIPMAAWLILLRVQAVRLLLGQGRFDWDDTIRTSLLVGWFAISLPAQALVPLFARVWYAYQNAWIPFMIGVVAEAVNIGSALYLRQFFGVTGLAMAFSLAAIVQVVGLFWLMHRQRLVDKSPLWPGAWKMVVALAASLLAGYMVRQLVGTVFPLRATWQVILQAGASGSACVIVYAGLAHLLKLAEWQLITDVFVKRLWRKLKPSSKLDLAENDNSSMDVL